MEKIESNTRNKYFYKDNGHFLWKVNSTYPTQIVYYVCTEVHCAARCNLNAGVLTVTIGHSHPPDMVTVARLKFRQRLRHLAATTSLTFQAIYLKCQSEDLLGAIHAGGLKDNLQIMKRSRVEQLPNCPKSLQELADLMANHGSRYAKDLDDPTVNFYRGIVIAGDGSRFVWFAADDVNRQVFERNEKLFYHLDGTFKCRPRIKCAQLLIIHAQVKSECIPLAYFLTEKMTNSVYVSVLQTFSSEFGRFGNTTPSVVMSDYEEAMRSAVREVFPTAKLLGCWFHFAQALRRMAKKVGLVHEDLAVATLGMALPLLPDEFLGEGIRFCRSKLSTNPSALEFGVYLERQWMRKSISVFREPTRTNNFAESFHRNLMRVIDQEHPNIWVFVEKLKVMNQAKLMDLTRVLRDSSRPRPKTIKQLTRDTKISIAQEQFVQTPNVEKLLKAVSWTTNCFGLNSDEPVSGDGNGDGVSIGSALLSSELRSSAIEQTPVSRKRKPPAPLDQPPPTKRLHSAIEHDHTYAKTTHV